MSGRRKRRRTKRKLRFPGCLGIAKALLLLLIEKERSGLIFKIIIGAKNRNRLFSVSQSATRQSVDASREI